MQAEMRSVLLAKAVNTMPIRLSSPETNAEPFTRQIHQVLSLRSGTCQDLTLRKPTRSRAWTRANTLNMENAGGSPQKKITSRPDQGVKLTHRMPMLFARSGTPPSQKKVKATTRKTPAAEEQTNFSAREGQIRCVSKPQHRCCTKRKCASRFCHRFAHP